MASQKQIEANRLNARKSTGPRSAEGKVRSSRNALKSGIDAKAQIILDEKAANLEALKTEYFDRFRPTTPEQRMLVDTLVDCEWLLRRYRVCEAQLWEHGAREAYKPDEEIQFGQAFVRMDQIFLRLQRRIDIAHRNYRNALDQLRRLQAEEDRDSEHGPDPASPQKQTVKPVNGFVPQSLSAQPVPPAAPDLPRELRSNSDPVPQL